ncbi:MarR family transcriptional regulator [Oculatella sp. LEGE 06141]|nr:MarR family transcriptional regulator [Oculatella sp. LEGE 06141]MBE9180928.1 MarR family transcriptional regulator [Oculatella sp. LEGE 06141]
MAVLPVVYRFMRAEMRQHGQPSLSLSQLRILGYLKSHGHASLSELADYLDVTRPTMSVMVERLVQRGVVDRTNDPQERRRVVLTVTAAGAQCFQHAFEATCTRVAEVLTGLSEVQLHQVMQGLEQLEEAFAETNVL